MGPSATWAPVSPGRRRKRHFHVFWGVISFRKYSTKGEDPDKCLGHGLALLHGFTGHHRPENSCFGSSLVHS